MTRQPRRRFFVLGFLVSVGLACGPGGPRPLAEPDPRVSLAASCGARVTAEGVSERLFELSPVLGGRDARAEDVLSALRAVESALRKVPFGLCHCAGLKELIIVHGLWARGQDIGGIALHRGDTIILSAASRGSERLERTFHHEFFHLLDFAYDPFDPERYTDPEWTALNPDGFAYGAGREGLVYMPLDPADEDRAIAGFASRYGTWKLSEDKAEVFALLVSKPWLAAERAREDAVLARKLALLVTRLEATCPGVPGIADLGRFP